MNGKGQLICHLLWTVKEQKEVLVMLEEARVQNPKEAPIFSQLFMQLSSQRKRQFKLNVMFKDFEMGFLHDVDIPNLAQYFRSEISQTPAALSVIEAMLVLTANIWLHHSDVYRSAIYF